MIWADCGVTDATWNQENDNFVDFTQLKNPSRNNKEIPCIYSQYREQIIKYLKSGKTIVTVIGEIGNWTWKDNVVLTPLG